MLTPALVSFSAAPASASSVTSATFTGGSGTATVNGTVFAKQGGALTLTVETSSDTKCVAVTGAATLPRQTSSTAKSNWTFTTTAPAGDGAQAFTVAASPNFNTNGCTGQTNSSQASYILDNTGPAVSAALDPAANAAGWNNTNTRLSWTAIDAGVGVSAAQPFAGKDITANGIVTETAAAQTDRLGNVGTAGSTTVRVDKASPSLTVTQAKHANGTTTVTFTCGDAGSGIVSCVVEGTSSPTIVVSGNRTVVGIATDAAGNTTRLPVEVRTSDSTAPLLSGAPQGTPSADGWHSGDVTVKWTASDPESGIPTPPADTKITGEGSGLTSTTTVKNGDGLETTATSTPAVKIDRTAPTTAISGTSNDWVNGTVNVSLAPTDNLAGVASTTYSVNGAAAKTGTSFSLTDEGTHTVTYSSTDKAGNVEATKTATVKIDKTAPRIAHRFTPSTYADGTWTNQDVTVTFEATDAGGSGLGAVTAPVTTMTEGADQQVVGTAADNAGNSATDTATVSIDKTKPVITAAADRVANAAGWYDHDVTVSYSATDALSGVAAKTDDTVLGEGRNQSASGSATDRAGNSQSASVTGIDVDKTVPVLTGSAPAGWHKDDVTVTWQASDALSGLAAAVPAPTTVTGEGANLSATESVLDRAGNLKTTTFSGIKIDRTKPTTVASVPETPASGWYRSGVPVTLTGSDNLSGATTYYTVNGGAQQTYSAPFTVSTAGTTTVTFWSVDAAGNVEEAPAPLTVKVDGAAPTTSVVLPPAESTGWYLSSGLPVAFEAADGASGSGIAATYYRIDGGEERTYGQPFTEQLSTGDHTITFWSVDLAGNVEDKESITQNVGVKVDSTPPTITGATVNADGTPRAANGHGWFNSDVDVRFTCEDVGSGVRSGVAGCAGDTTVINESATQTVRGDAVDVAGNRSSTAFGPVKLDKTAPTLSGALPEAGRTTSGWYKANVTVAWTGADALSGIDTETQPADSVITGEGANLGASASIKDKAGNTGSGSVSSVKIDRTAPVVTGAIVTDTGAARTANPAGWFNSPVRVRYSATDELSKVAQKSGDEVLSEDGAGQSATGTARDNADNTASTTVTGINIDSKAPTSEADIQCEGKNNYCRGAKATIALSAVDQAGLSGVKDMTYSTDAGKTWTTLAGDRGSFDVTLNRSGKVSVQFRAADKAGNVETVNTIEVKYDTVAPTVSHKLAPEANAAGWNNEDTTVTFSAVDDSDGSGIDAATVTKAVQVTRETAGQVVNGEAYDLAGNKGSDSVTVKLDRTAPTNVAAVKAGKLGANGWYTGPVTVGFTATDALSGIAEAPADVVLNTDGAAQKASGTAKDNADNEKTTVLDGINIDSVKPVITMSAVKASYTLGEPTGVSCSATDATSGVDADGCRVTTSGGTANGVGTITYTATATDKAGNVQTATGTYKVVYAWSGFSQPINDTAHQTDQGVSVFKGGSTVPAKFQVKNAKGEVVQASSASWLTPSAGAAMAAPISEEAFALTSTTGGLYRYDTTDRQYIYNWSTKGMKVGQYYRIGVTLDDGQTYSVSIGLR